MVFLRKINQGRGIKIVREREVEILDRSPRSSFLSRWHLSRPERGEWVLRYLKYRQVCRSWHKKMLGVWITGWMLVWLESTNKEENKGQRWSRWSQRGDCETEQSTTILLYVHCLPFVCGKSLAKNKFTQRSERMQKQRKIVQQD